MGIEEKVGGQPGAALLARVVALPAVALGIAGILSGVSNGTRAGHAAPDSAYAALAKRAEFGPAFPVVMGTSAPAPLLARPGAGGGGGEEKGAFREIVSGPRLRTGWSRPRGTVVGVRGRPQVLDPTGGRR